MVDGADMSLCTIVAVSCTDLSYVHKHTDLGTGTDTLKIASYNYQCGCSLAYGYRYGNFDRSMW